MCRQGRLAERAHTSAPVHLARERLLNQRLAGNGLASPQAVVEWMGAVQAQEFVDAQWALALRSRQKTRNAIEQALHNGAILRTHVLRPTWHFVAPADIRWMLALTGPYISKRMAPYNRKLELDRSVFRKSQAIFARALRGGTYLTRQELKTALQRGGVDPGDVQRLAHLVMQAELDALICSGPRRGKQFTYALLDERVPASPPRSRDASLAELARRYFTSHGPAQVRDFAWWSGLPAGDARTGVAMVEAELERHDSGGCTYWSAPAPRARRVTTGTWLLPIYDEYLVGYKDRSAAFDRSRWTRTTWPESLNAAVVIDGVVVGTWRRVIAGNRVEVAVKQFARLTSPERSGIERAAAAYGDFMNVEVDLSFES